MKKFSIVAILFLVVVTYACRKTNDSPQDSELFELLINASGGKGLSYFSFPASNDYAHIPQDPKNPITAAKVELGKFLFHEVQLGGSPKLPGGIYTYSCASCHNAKAGFQACVPQGMGEGGWGFGMSGEGRVPNPAYPIDSVDVQAVRSPSAMNGAYQEATLWNGQLGATGVNEGTQYAWTPGTPKELNHLGYQGLETQVLAGQINHRLKIDVDWLRANTEYHSLFDKAFPDVPEDRRISKLTVALAIAAYERTLMASQAPFQVWLRGDQYAMNEVEKQGAKLFFGKAECYTCHNGPALNAMNFYALGMADLQNGVRGVFNVNPNDGAHKGRGGFTGRAEDMYKFKVPQLYNLADSRFYGHGASFTSIAEVIRYKNAAVSQNPNVPATQLAQGFRPLHLNESEIQALATFIETALRDPQLKRYVPAYLPSGRCFPNADQKSRADMGCN